MYTGALLLSVAYVCELGLFKARFPLPELTAGVDGWPVSITRQHGPVKLSTRLVETGLYCRLSLCRVNMLSVERSFTGCVCHEYDRWTGDVDIKNVTILQTSDFGLFWHDLCRYKVRAGVRVGQKVPPCVWGECDFHVNWLHVSRTRPTHWRLNDDFDINCRRRRFTRNV